MNGQIYIDGHAHWHDRVAIVDFLDWARKNFRGGDNRAVPSGQLKAVLCLADFPGAEGWARLQSSAVNQAIEGWELKQADEQAVSALHSEGDCLWLIAGRQAVTAEGVEVMALGTADALSPGQSLSETLSQVRQLGALPVLPWGAGKWWGKRGKLIKESLRNESLLLLGDNGGRPECWRPLLLALARRKKVPVLPGSDPLPVKADETRNGAFGVVLTDLIDETSPSVWVKGQLAELSSHEQVFGGPLDTVSFLLRQLALRIQKRTPV